MKKYLIVILALVLAVGGADAQKKGKAGKKAKTTATSKASGSIAGHDYVDLGLPSGIVWATCNVGAKSPEGYGDYFAWGETSTKEYYSDSNCETWYKSISWLINNNYMNEYGILLMSKDAARANWGSTWRMPTRDEINELYENTTSKWTTRNGVKGRLVTSKRNGKSIFLPAAGFREGTSLNKKGVSGYYRGSMVYEKNTDNSCCLSVETDYLTWGWYPNAYGETVRPVSVKPVFITPEQKESMAASGMIADHEYVDLGLPSGVKWATCNVGASSPEGYGDYFAWGETTTKSSYDENNCASNKKDNAWLTSNGYVDNSGNLTPEHDAATAQWGATWRMPTKAEIDELVGNTTATWMMNKDVLGCLVTSKINGKSIFLPAAGYRYGKELFKVEGRAFYFSSTPHESELVRTYNIFFDPSLFFSGNGAGRYCGTSVRPVTK